MVEKVDVKKLVDYWYRESGYSFDVAKALLENKKYPESLFFGHLSLEKILKAVIVSNTKQHSPPIHDLTTLIKKSRIPYTQQQYQQLGDYNNFYLSGRYDEYKMNFRKKCTPSFTKESFQGINECYVWLKKELKTISLLK